MASVSICCNKSCPVASNNRHSGPEGSGQTRCQQGTLFLWHLGRFLTLSSFWKLPSCPPPSVKMPLHPPSGSASPASLCWRLFLDSLGWPCFKVPLPLGTLRQRCSSQVVGLRMQVSLEAFFLSMPQRLL